MIKINNSLSHAISNDRAASLKAWILAQLGSQLQTAFVSCASIALFLSTVGCSSEPASTSYDYDSSDYDSSAYDGYDEYGNGSSSKNIRGVTGPTFREVKSSNVDLSKSADSFRFTTDGGAEVSLAELAPEKPVVLVVMRGATPICPMCSTQTARLISSYKDFADAGAEVVVVYPQQIELGNSVEVEEFLETVKMRLGDGELNVPFPFVFDVGLDVVSGLGIKEDLAKPSTYIFDDKHRLVFAYVGESTLHRPDIDSMLALVTKLSGTAAAGRPKTSSEDSDSAVSNEADKAVSTDGSESGDGE